jgi:hypothetical protein
MAKRQRTNSGRLVSHTGGAHLHTQSFQGTDSRSRVVSASLGLGTALIAIGAALSLLAVRSHRRVVEELNRPQVADRHASRQGVLFGLFRGGWDHDGALSDPDLIPTMSKAHALAP